MSADNLKIFAFPGLGTDHRIFTYLEVNAQIIHVPWKTPRPSDTLATYAKYLIEEYELGNNYAFLGVSFGGMIASELHRVYQPKFSCIVASVKGSQEMPSWLQRLGKVKPLWYLPSRFFKPPFGILRYPLGISNRRHLELFREFYKNSSAIFLKRSIKMIASWQFSYEKDGKSMIHIHGDRDKLFPFHKIAEPKQQLPGTHFLIVTAAKQINTILNVEINR